MNATIPVTAALLRSLPLPTPIEGAKEGRGTVLVVAGCREVPGAAILAAEASLRAGAGKLTVATSRSIAVPLGLAMPEAMVVALTENEEGGIIAGEGLALVQRFSACDAVLLGPGMTADAHAQALTTELMAGLDRVPFVLDAGAMKGLQEGGTIVRSRQAPTIVTPHAGEMAHLLGRERADIEADPLGAARTAADRLGVVAVMKGACTYIAAPSGETWSYDGGHVGLATSGSGDVLAGLIVGLVARGAPAVCAAIWGVYLHGEAGRVLAAKVGPLGFLARELPAEVPQLLARADPEEADA